MATTTLKRRTAIMLGISIATVLFLIFLFFYMKYQFGTSRTEMTEDVMIEKITKIGKLELVRYSMKDVIEKKQIRRFLPDQRILFVAAGEVTGCIDLAKVRKADISSSSKDSVTISLPKPEICYTKLDHQRSKVYDVSGAWFPSDAKSMVEDIYQVAEQQLLKNAKEMGILKKTEENARSILKPLLENVSSKKVGFVFR